MPPTLILIRHGEAEHNATEDYTIRDPALTQNGLQQCGELQEHFQQRCPIADRVEYIVSSPMRRTLRTTLTALDWLIQRGVPVEVDAMWQGSERSLLECEFPTLDFSTLDPIYPDKGPATPYAFKRSANFARGQGCLQRLYARTEKVIAVVSHAGFLRTGISKRRYHYADYRIFTFRKTGDVLTLVEGSKTAKKGGGLGKSPKGMHRIEEWDFPPEE